MIADLGCQLIGTRAYGLAGLHILSELPLPGVPAWPGDSPGGSKIVIRRADVPRSLSVVTAEFSDGQCNQNELLLDISGVSRYLVRGGDEILVDPAVGSTPSEVCAFLLGTAFGVLCHQRGILPLHASGIDVPNGCVAFVGKSRAGKSTLAAALAARGHQVISDDVCFLQRGGHEQIRAWPGLSRLRLWEDALNVLGRDQPKGEREFRGVNKYLIPRDPPWNPNESRPLRRIYLVDPAPDGDCASVHRMQGSTAVEVIIQNIYRSGLNERMGRKPALFVACAATARVIPVFRFSRPLGFHAFRESVDVLENHLSDLS